jgi:hypothetical protein
MKLVKIYLGVATAFLIIAIGLGIYVWYTVQKLNGTVDREGNVTSTSAQFDSVELAEEGPEPIVIQTDTLGETQQNMLESFGFDEGSITITSEMIICAENALGKERLRELTDGSSPTPLESMKLLPCLRP